MYLRCHLPVFYVEVSFSPVSAVVAEVVAVIVGVFAY